MTKITYKIKHLMWGLESATVIMAGSMAAGRQAWCWMEQ